jgi:hypothetical protein
MFHTRKYVFSITVDMSKSRDLPWFSKSCSFYKITVCKAQKQGCMLEPTYQVR